MTFVHLAGKHALKFQLLHLGLHPIEILGDGLYDFRFLFLDCQLQHILRVGEAGMQSVERFYDVFEVGSLTAQGLCFFRIAPDIRIFQFPADLFESVTLFSVVKGTP